MWGGVLGDSCWYVGRESRNDGRGSSTTFFRLLLLVDSPSPLQQRFDDAVSEMYRWSIYRVIKQL